MNKKIRTLERTVGESSSARPRSESRREVEQFAAKIQGEKELLVRQVQDLEKKLQEKEAQLKHAAVAPPNGAVPTNGEAPTGGGVEVDKLKEMVKKLEEDVKKATLQGKIAQMKAEKHRRDELEKAHTEAVELYEQSLTKHRAEVIEVQAKAKADHEAADKAVKEKKELDELQTRTRLAFEGKSCLTSIILTLV